MKLTKTNLEQGLSLIELLLVVSVIGLLSSLLIANYNEYYIKTERKRAITELYQLHLFAEGYFSVHNSYPDTDTLIACSYCALSPHYDFSIEVNNTEGEEIFSLLASPKTAAQQKDTSCYTLILKGSLETANKDKEGNLLSHPTCWN
jgi:type IV pilus assembly protein PilE